jgi:hypothetical protein
MVVEKEEKRGERKGGRRGGMSMVYAQKNYYV